MRKSLGLALMAALAFSVGGTEARAASVERPAAINGTGNAIVTPAFDGSGGSPISSYIRFYDGGSAATTFTITIVGSQTEQVYGHTFTIQIPSNASPQYSLGQLLVLAGTTGAGAGAANGDTSFALFITDPDAAAGYTHVTFNGVTTLFENNSVCNNGLLPAITLANGDNVLTNVHTSQLANYPSVIYFFNYTNAPVTEHVGIFDAGVVLSDGKTLDSTAGLQVGSTTIQIPANTTVTKNFTDLQAAVHWTPGSNQLHANILTNNLSGSADVILAHSIYNATLGGSINMTATCGVNPSNNNSNIIPTQTFIANASAGTAFSLTANQTLQAYTITNGAAIVGGTASAPTGSVQSNPTGSITQTATGFNFTLPDGKAVNYTLTSGAADVNGTGDFQTVTTDGTESVEVALTNKATSTLSYSTYGQWEEDNDAAGDYPIAVGTLAAGIPTSAASMPSGTFTYTGNITGFGFTSTALGNIKSGTVSLTVNFSAATITGTVTNIVTKAGGSSGAAGTMSSITLNGTISGTGFTMTATGAAGGSGSTVNISGASGTFSGTFYGPGAVEMAATFGMSGSANVLAAFGAIQ